MKFALFRTGEVRVWYDLNDLFGRDCTAQPLSRQELVMAAAFPAQAYFFLKDISHLHFHHEPDSDQLLPFTKLQSGATDAVHKANELKWRRETLWGLAHVVSQYRRQNSLYDHKKVLGVLAYADAFQSTLARVWRGRDLRTKMSLHGSLATYDFAHTRASVEAMESLAAWRRSGRIQMFAILSGVILSSLALWGAALQIRPVMCEIGTRSAARTAELCERLTGWTALRITIWITENPLQFTGALFVLGFAVFVVIFRDASFVPFGKGLVRFALKITKAIGATTARRLPFATQIADLIGHFVRLALLTLGLAAALRLALGAIL